MPDGMRLAPHQIPRMRAALDRALDTLTPALERLEREGRIEEDG